MDDKSARYLLGEGFKRQLQRGDTLDRTTLVCSKTDGIVLSEVRGVLKQDADFSKDIERIDEARAAVDRDRAALLQAITTLRAETESLDSKTTEAMSKEKAYMDLRALGAKGKVVYPPVFSSATASGPSKRQRSGDGNPSHPPKKNRTQQYLSQTYLSPSRSKRRHQRPFRHPLPVRSRTLRTEATNKTPRSLP